MPQIIVTAGDREGDAVTLCERVNVTDFESDHFQAQLVERLRWAVEDAHALARSAPDADPSSAPDTDELEPIAWAASEYAGSGVR